MDYELAKQLKDAGFPQKEADGFSGIIAHAQGTADDSVYYPTLSELIEACGDDFRNVSLSLEPPREWHAAGVNVPTSRHMISVFHGSTPEEAVAHLYLALRKREV